MRRKLIRVLLFAGAVTAFVVISCAGAAAVPNAAKDVWGIPLAADSLANLEVGKHVGRSVGYRFRALQSGRLSAVRVYLVYRSGYTAGTGGQVRVELRSDNGHGFPGATVLASGSITNPTAENFPVVRFVPAARVRAGLLYHVVLTNTDPKPATNYVSVNGLSVDGSASQGPDNQDLAVVWKFSRTRQWQVHPRLIPIFEVTYRNGRRQGQRYVDARAESGVVSIGGDSGACEVFTSAKPRVVTEIHLRMRNGGSSSPLKVELVTKGEVVASASIAARRVPSSYAWVSAPLPAVLEPGVSYSVALSSAQGPLEIFPYQKGIRYGFANPFPGGRADLPGGDLDYPMYFSSAPANKAVSAPPTEGSERVLTPSCATASQ